MLTVNINIGASMKSLFISKTPLTVSQIWDQIQHTTALPRDNFYIIYNGRLATDFETLSVGSANITPRIFGGKGGFGSMLRAIGAQIEKTTNREACRDLSGRRLRDINEEKRLKLWIEKQSVRKEEAAERKKRKLEKLRSEPKHEFKDKKYDQERSVLTEKVADSVEEGFKAAAATSFARKRAAETEKEIIKKKKVTLSFGLDLDSDELDSSDDDACNDKNSDKHSEDNSNSDDSKECKSNSADEVSSDDKNDLAALQKSELVDNSESKVNSSDEVSADERTPVEKLKLVVNN